MIMDLQQKSTIGVGDVGFTFYHEFKQKKGKLIVYTGEVIELKKNNKRQCCFNDG